jgi:membrane peptidoglycan carboxypeptidase
LLCSVRAPSYYLLSDRSALEVRTSKYVHLMRDAGILDVATAQNILHVPMSLLSRAPAMAPLGKPEKEIYSIRTGLLKQLGVSSLYDLDRLHLEVNTTLDAGLQEELKRLLASMKDPEFINLHGLRGERLIGDSDPLPIVYGVTLFERTPEGNLLRAQADTLDSPFNLGDGMKMELGSTAKLRTLAHYLEIIERIYAGRENLNTEDPITVWARETLKTPLTLEQFLGLALDRKYSASQEWFFTGGGVHSFANFDSDMDAYRLTVRDAFRSSVNLVFVRLMRDLVRFHAARLPYSTERVMNDATYDVRHELLNEAADKEATKILARSYQRFRGLTEEEMIKRLLGTRAKSMRHLSILFFAWNPHAGTADLLQWLQRRMGEATLSDAEKMKKAYEPSHLNLLDYGYLAGLHPLTVWCAGVLHDRPGISWDNLLAESEDVRRLSATWLFKTRNRGAQDTRLRIRIEEDAFARMTPYWQSLGFPFDALVPSLATAIGSSSDRPSALAELMGIILNDGVRLPSVRVTRMRFAAETPYETVLVHSPGANPQVMHPTVARMLRAALSDVVQQGTARRLADAFILPDGSRIVAGGKTGSGDNRYNARASIPNRTATFVFYVGDKYFGVVTAYVKGPATEKYKFTSALAVTFLKMFSPQLVARLSR